MKNSRFLFTVLKKNIEREIRPVQLHSIDHAFPYSYVHPLCRNFKLIFCIYKSQRTLSNTIHIPDVLSFFHTLQLPTLMEIKDFSYHHTSSGMVPKKQEATLAECHKRWSVSSKNYMEMH